MITPVLPTSPTLNSLLSVAFTLGGWTLSGHHLNSAGLKLEASLFFSNHPWTWYFLIFVTFFYPNIMLSLYSKILEIKSLLIFPLEFTLPLVPLFAFMRSILFFILLKMTHLFKENRKCRNIQRT